MDNFVYYCDIKFIQMEENRDYKVHLNEVFINKLESIQYDIKYYININAFRINKTTDGIIFVDDDDLSKLIEIRNELKILNRKLKGKLNKV